MNIDLLYRYCGIKRVGIETAGSTRSTAFAAAIP
jgi:hypothetical protein